MSERVVIFDTTLRDGEQSPGCSMTVPEKVRMARKLVELGVDILEAGFPIASEGDFEAVQAVSREFPEARVAGLARCCAMDVERAAEALEPARQPAHSHLHRHQRHSSEIQIAQDPAAGAGRGRGGGGAGPASRGRRRVFRRRWRAHRCRIPDRDLEGRGGRRRGHGEHPRYGGLFHAEGIRRTDRQGGPRAGFDRHRERALPRRSGPGGGQFPHRHRGRRTAGGMHHQRHRRTRRQLFARRSGHDFARRAPTAILITPASTPSTCTRPANC